MQTSRGKKMGLLTYKNKHPDGHFYAQFRISDYDMAQILQYIAKVPHKAEPFRNSKGQFSKIPIRPKQEVEK